MLQPRAVTGCAQVFPDYAPVPVYGRHAGLWPFEKISPLLVPSVLTYRSEPAQVRHAWIEKAIVPPSGDHVGLENPPACARIFCSDPSAFAIPIALLGWQSSHARGQTTTAIFPPSGDQEG